MWTFLSGIGGRVAMFAAAAAAAAGAFLAVRRSGEQRQQTKDLVQEVKNDTAANEARAEVDRANPDAVNNELRNDWQRR